MKLHYSFFAFLLIIFSCSDNEEEEPSLKFTAEQLELFHNGGERTWKVVEVYEYYSQNRLDDMRECIIDDTYTFRANSTEVQMNMGETSCFWDQPDEQASLLALSYWEEEGKVFLSHGRSEAKDGQSSAIIYLMALEEISANRMVFANGTAPNLARALVLEAID